MTDKLGDGKEGAVYEAENRDDAIKIFKTDTRGRDELEQKIRVMTENPPTEDENTRRNHKWFAWPTDIVYYQNEFAGYAMPLVDVGEFETIRTYIRDEFSRESGLTEGKIKLAHNLAVVVDLVHAQGHAIGDFNYQNILINNNRVTMIDCDAYSIGGTHGEEFHGTTMYDETIPPEGRPDENILYTQRADNFNLAVWIFRIVSGNLNPYQAKGDLAASGKLLEMMEKNPFPFWNPKDGLIEPPTGQSQYDELPPELRLLFESAFLGGKFHPFKRPSAGLWRMVLMRMYEQMTANSHTQSRDRITLEGCPTRGTPSGQAMSPDKVTKARKQIGAKRTASLDKNDNNVTVFGKVKSVKELTEFKKNGEKDFVSHVLLEDDTGRVDVTFWNKQGVVAARSLHPGLTLKATGYVKEAPDFTDVDKEVHVDKFESYSIEPQIDNYEPLINNLTEETSHLHIRGRIVGVGDLTEFSHSGSTGHVVNVVVADKSGHCRVTLWNEMAKRLDTVPLGLTLEIIDGYTKLDNGQLFVNIDGDAIPPIVTDIDDEYNLDCDAIDAISSGERIDIRGTVVESKMTNTAGGDQCRSVWIRDRTGEMCVELRNRLSAYDIDVGDEVFVTSIAVTSDSNDSTRGTSTKPSVLSILD